MEEINWNLITNKFKMVFKIPCDNLTENEIQKILGKFNWENLIGQMKNKLVCIKAEYGDMLILGEIYDGIWAFNELHKKERWNVIISGHSNVENPRNQIISSSYPKECFIPLSEWREEQINNILL